MALILSQCDETTRGEMTLGQSPEYDVMTGGLLKFIKQLRKVCTHFRDKNVFFGLTISMITEQHVRPTSKSKNVFFGSSISKFTKHHIRPTTRVKKLLDAHPDNNCMWKNTDPCNVSLDNTTDSEEPVNTTMSTTSIRSGDSSNATQKSVATTPPFTSEENNETWYDTNEKYDSWQDAIETMDNYQEWINPPMNDKSGYQFLLSMLCKSFASCYFIHFRPKLLHVNPSHT